MDIKKLKKCCFVISYFVKIDIDGNVELKLELFNFKKKEREERKFSLSFPECQNMSVTFTTDVNGKGLADIYNFRKFITPIRLLVTSLLLFGTQWNNYRKSLWNAYDQQKALITDSKLTDTMYEMERKYGLDLSFTSDHSIDFDVAKTEIEFISYSSDTGEILISDGCRWWSVETSLFSNRILDSCNPLWKDYVGTCFRKALSRAEDLTRIIYETNSEFIRKMLKENDPGSYEVINGNPVVFQFSV